MGAERSGTLELKRTVGLFSALSTVMGTVIGAGVFFKAVSVAGVTGSISLHMWSWFLGGVISICAGLTAAELAAAIPKTGGMVKYIEHAYGETAAFLLGWAQIIIYFPASVAALSIVLGTQLAQLFGVNQNFVVPFAIVAAITITCINFLGSKTSGIFQSITLICKLIPLALIVVFGLFYPSGTEFSLFPIVSGDNLPFFKALGAGLLATMFAYDGWIHVGNIAGECKNPTKDLPRAILFGIIGVMLVYSLVNAVFLKIMPIDQIAVNQDTATIVASKIFGNFGGRLVTTGILVSVCGTINGFTMTGMRLPYVMAQEKRLPFWKTFSKVSPNTQTPIMAGLLELGVSCIMIIISLFSSNGFNMLSDMLVFVIWMFYVLIFIEVIILRKREPKLKRPYKVPFYPIIPLVAILAGLFILFMMMVNQFSLALTGIGMTALGIPIYLYMKKKYG